MTTTRPEGTPSSARRQAGREAPAYEIRYTQTFDSAIQAGRSFQAGTYRLYHLILGAGIAVGAYLALSYPTVGVALAALCALMLVMTRFAVLDRLIRRRRYQDLLDRPVRLSLDEDGVVWEGPQATSRIPWTSIDEVRVDARMVLFIRDRTLVTYVPTSAFAGPAEQAEVVAYARRRIDAASGIDGTERSIPREPAPDPPARAS